MCLSNVGETSLEAGKAAQQAESSKFNTYRELSNNYTVIPAAVETIGIWGPIGLKFISEIGARIKEASGEKRSKSFLFQALSMAVQKGNVISVLGTTPDTKKLDEIFYFL